MAPIVPRWEWRTFGESFGDADRRFSSLAPHDVEESDEVYLPSPIVDENVKIRSQLMDIKALQQVNTDGLEQWKPVMKAGFPLSAADVGRSSRRFRSPRRRWRAPPTRGTSSSTSW